MDKKKLQEEIQAISKIADSVPDKFKEKCFELLLINLLSGELTPKLPSDMDKHAADEKAAPHKPKKQKIPITTKLNLFMQRTGITQEHLEKLLMYSDGEVYFIKEPPLGKAAINQIKWALLLALRNVVIKDRLFVDPEEVRSNCQEKACYDKSNFASIFKRPKNIKLFKKTLESQGEPQELSPEGEAELAKIIISIVGESA